ncbi:uncharacterized protein [Haliotis cracherodii]|uniref:uncharacterized protein n=1 Tax=Haliotis cracherodii TaxID=6455 RepID=UPI0039EBA166
MESKCQSSVVCAPVGVNTGGFMAKDNTVCQESTTCEDDSYNGTPGRDDLGLRSATGAYNSNLSNANVAGVVHGDNVTNHATQYNININSFGAKEDSKIDNDEDGEIASVRKASVGSIEINLTSHRVDIRLGCQGEATPHVVHSQLTEDKLNSDTKIGVTGAIDESKTPMTIPKEAKSGIQEDGSLSSYRPTIGVGPSYTGVWNWFRGSFSSKHGTSEPSTDEDSYSFEEVDDFILVSPSDINLQGKVKVSSHDCTDGKYLHPTKTKRASKHQEDGHTVGTLMTNLFQDPPQTFETQIPITSLQEGTQTTGDSVVKGHSHDVRSGCDLPGNDINSLHASTETGDYFHLEYMLAKVKTMHDPWRSYTEEAFLSLLALSDNGDIAQLKRLSVFLRSVLIETQNVFYPSANHQSFFNYVKLLQRIRNLSDHVRWRTELNVSSIVNIAHQDPSKMSDIVTFLDNI